MRVLAIAGSLRAASSNQELLRAIARLAPAGTEVEVYAGLGDIPAFSPDLDVDPAPPAVADFRARLRAADAVIVCTPEYAFGMPGILKNALDWLVSSGETYEKPVAALSAAPSHGGAANALAWLRQTLRAVSAAVPPEATFPIPFVRKKLAGDVLTDAETIAAIRAMFAALERGAAAKAAADAEAANG
jgi:chromate reductase, NAD(P)H dehydrogenase (quinone)